MYKPCGHFLVIELDDVPKEEVSAGGILLQQKGDKNKREQKAMSLARVISVGPNCWAGFTDAQGNWAPWCKEGDKIMIAKYAGQEFPYSDGISKDQEEYIERLRLIKDDDVLCVVGDE